MYVRRADTPGEGEAFIHRIPSKVKSRHDACIAGLSKSRRTRHEAVIYEILAGLAHDGRSLFFWRREAENMISLSLHFEKKKCGCEEGRYSRMSLLYIARGQSAKRHAATALDFRVPQKAIVMAEGYGLLRGDAHT